MSQGEEYPNSAYTALLQEKKKFKQKIQEAEERQTEYNKQIAPVLEQLKRIEKQGNEQIKVLQEDNERQKKQITKLDEKEKRAQIEAKKAKIISIVSFCVSTVIAIASLVVAIVK